MEKELRTGPAAPKDPEKKRPYFYIMHNKEIFGNPAPEGRGVQFIFESDGRLISAAGIAGNIKDPEILDLLKTSEGFKKLVHSIGVSVTESSGEEKVNFVFQMYGEHQNDPASSIQKEFVMNGEEHILPLSEVSWMSTDKEPGQIRFEFEHQKKRASADVRLYLNDGFTAPEQPSDDEVAFDSPEYAAMIKNSRMHEGNLSALRRAIEKAKKGEEVTIGFIGGSITQGAGPIPINENCYARLYADKFIKHYSSPEKVRFVKAGVGGTPSELGMIRFERDVLRDGTEKPDIIVIEFAVNDDGDETKGVCYESLVRKALSLPWQPAVILLFAVFVFDWNLQDRLSPVGERYDLPMVSIMNAVTPQFKLMPDEGLVVSKNQFFYDQYHPSNTGHRIMCDCLLDMTKAAETAKEAPYPDVSSIDPVIGAAFENVKLLDRREIERLDVIPGDPVVTEGSFTGSDTEIQRVEMDDAVEQVPEFPYNWYYDGSSDKPAPFKIGLSFEKLLLVFKDTGDVAFGSADVYVDGEKVMNADPLKVGWTHCNAVIIADYKTEARHEIEIRIAEGDERKKFTILGFGVV